MSGVYAISPYIIRNAGSIGFISKKVLYSLYIFHRVSFKNENEARSSSRFDCVPRKLYKRIYLANRVYLLHVLDSERERI